MSHAAFTLFMLLLLVVLLAHVFACERGDGAGTVGGARGHHAPHGHQAHHPAHGPPEHDITQYIVPTAYP